MDVNGQLYAWGRGREGNVVPGDFHGDHPVPTPVLDLPSSDGRIVRVGGSGVMSYVQVANGSDEEGVFIYGSSKRGQLGLGKGIMHCGMDGTMERLKYDGRNVKKVRVGWGHGLGLMDDGEVVSWGFNESGQLGRMQKKGEWGDIGRVDLGDARKGVNISCGYDHCHVILENGSAVTWGVSETSALGLGDNVHSSDRATLIKFADDAEKVDMKRVEGGFGHSLFLDIHGGLWSCGWNDSGQLGVSPDGLNERGSPSRIPLLENEKIVDMGVGRINSAAVTQGGALYTWGGGTHGRLGHEDKKDVHEPRMVYPDHFENRRVIAVACGLDHTLVLVERK